MTAIEQKGETQNEHWIQIIADTTQAPTTDSFRRAKEKEDHHRRFLRTTITEWGLRHTARATSSDRYGHNDNFDGETTFM